MADYLEKITQTWYSKLLLSIVPILIILSPLFFAGKIFFSGDFLCYSYSNFNFYAASLKSGQSIIFNPNNFSGFPNFIGSMGFLSPIHYFLFKIFPAAVAFNLLILLSLSLAIFFTWLLVIKLGLPNWAGFIGGLTYVFSQWNWITDLSILTSLPFLPLLFLIIWQTNVSKKIWYIFLGGLVIGLSWLGVNFNWTLLILFSSFLFTLFLFWQERKPLILYQFLIMIFIGSLIGLLILIPVFKYTSLSARASGVAYSQATTEALGAGDFIRYFLPYFQTSLFNLANGGAFLYLGALSLFFAIFATAFKQSLIRFFTFLFLFCLILAVKYSPLFWLFNKLPGFSYFRVPSRWMFIGSFAASILVSFGLEKFVNFEKDKWSNFLLKTLKWLILLLLIGLTLITLVFLFFGEKIIVFTQAYFDKYLYAKTSGLSIDYYHQFIKNTFFEIKSLFNIFDYHVFLPLIFIFLSYFVLVYFKKRKLKIENFSKVIVLVILANFLIVLFNYHPFISRASVTRQPEIANFLQNHPGKFFTVFSGFTEYNKLTVPLKPSPDESFIFLSELLPPNTNLIYNLESADYYDNLMSRPMARLLAFIGSDQTTAGERLVDLKAPIEEKIKLFQERKKILDLLGIKYIISGYPLDENIFPKVFETKIPPYNIPLAIYENKEARSLFYFAKNIQFIKFDEMLAYQKVVKSELEDNTIIVECSDCQNLNVDGEGTIELLSKGNDFINLKTASKSKQHLVLQYNFLPDWHAYVDGNETSIYRINSVFMGVFVPEGEHRILFEFQKPWRLKE
ncbi:MAG: YfhO family protein [bacterium]